MKRLLTSIVLIRLCGCNGATTRFSPSEAQSSITKEKQGPLNTRTRHLRIHIKPKAKETANENVNK